MRKLVPTLFRLALPLALLVAVFGSATAASAMPASFARAALVVPSTSPAVSNYDVSGSDALACADNFACASIQYNGAVWRKFDFYRYGTYNLRSWNNEGWAINRQSGGAAMRLYDVNDNQKYCIAAGTSQWVNWSPIWRIRVTASSC